jgi:hypothetical protein
MDARVGGGELASGVGNWRGWSPPQVQELRPSMQKQEATVAVSAEARGKGKLQFKGSVEMCK